MEFLAEKGSIETMKKYTDKHRDNIPGEDYQAQPHPYSGIFGTNHNWVGSTCPWVPDFENSAKLFYPQCGTVEAYVLLLCGDI